MKTLHDLITKVHGYAVDPLPCPFCGEKPGSFVVTKYHNCGEPYSVAKVTCSNKGCRARLSISVTDDHWKLRTKSLDYTGITEFGISVAWTVALWNDVYEKWNRRYNEA